MPRAKKTKAQEEAKRQQGTDMFPKGKVTVSDNDSDPHAIDHLTILDNHEEPDTLREPLEDIVKRNSNDLSFWNNSWTWTKSERATDSTNPADAWYIVPTAQLLGQVMEMAPVIHDSCEAHLVGTYADQLNRERERHLEFFRSAENSDLVSECLDMLTAYQRRFFEAVQQYLGRSASYDNICNNDNIPESQVEASRLRKQESGNICRNWTARLLALVEAYHSVVSDERAYNLHYNFSPNPNSADYGLYRWSVQQALNKIGQRLSRSVKNGKLDAAKYNIPRPWLEQEQKSSRRKADEMISDFG